MTAGLFSLAARGVFEQVALYPGAVVASAGPDKRPAGALYRKRSATPILSSILRRTMLTKIFGSCSYAAPFGLATAFPARVRIDHRIQPKYRVVEDEKAIKTAIAGLVRSLGGAARVFDSGLAFLQSDGIAQTVCLISDVRMPNLSGVQTHDRLIQLG